ncbi:MAG: GNAT family N-acetyltransferase [Luteitalea sp.]|nr:GNAT family N-acetyltransferase [Luteitalea sp.]
MTTGVVCTLDDFAALRSEWNELVCRMELPEIFYAWEWHWFYHKHFRNGVPLFIVTVRDGGRLIGLAPMCLTRRKALGRRVRVLETIVGNMADYRNLLIDGTQNRWRTVEAIWEALDRHSSEWDVIEMRQVPSQDVTVFQLTKTISQAADMRHAMRVASRTSRMYYAGDYQSKMDAKRIHRIRNKRAQLTREGRLTCTVGEPDTEEFWLEFLRLHQAQRPDSPLHRPAGRRLFADLRGHFGARDELECSRVRIDGRIAAMHFGFRDQRKIYYYMPVIAEEFRQERAGNILTLSMVEHYAPTHREFDLLRGDESYKTWWTDDLAVNYRLRIHRNSNVAAWADGVVPATKEYLRALAFPGYMASRVRGVLKRRQDRVE